MTAIPAQSIYLRTSVMDLMANGSGKRIGHDLRGVSRGTFARRLRGAFADVIGLVAIVLSFPAAVLLIGTPIALAIAFVLWLGRVALGVL